MVIRSVTREAFKVISGGQTGADLAGLDAAFAFRIRTGGWIPRGFRTELGSKPEYGPKYGLIEVDSDRYDERTEQNLIYSDGTVIFKWTSSPGSNLTKRLAKQIGKPFLELAHMDWAITPDSDKITKFLYDNNIKILNIAGNRESVAHGLYTHAKYNLEQAFKSYLGLTEEERRPKDEL
jgi:hypothetical protein